MRSSSLSSPPAPVARDLERAVLARSGRREGEEIRFRCPYPGNHSNGDADPSASYNPKKAVWYCPVCNEGGGWKNLCELMDIASPRGRRSRSRPTATYVYRDKNGNALRRKLRWEPGFGKASKSFTWQKPGKGEDWTKCKGDGNPKTLYHSEHLPAARQSGATVWLVEGEKDADAAGALGLVAVTNPEGAGKWQPRYSEQLRGLGVIIVPDKDEPGRRHAESVARSLHDVASSVKVFELPGEGVKDLSDWIAAEPATGSGEEEPRQRLEELAHEAEARDPTRSQPRPDSTVQGILDSLCELPKSPDPEVLEALLRQLADKSGPLDAVAREVVRERALRALTGKVAAPGRLLNAALKDPALTGGDHPPERSQHLQLEDPEAWPEPVDGAALLDKLEAFVLRYAVLPTGGAVALALWTLFTYVHDAAAVSPLLALTSPVKRCGKTTILHLLAAVVRRPLPTSNITPAALFRTLEKFHPTLLVDEADTFLGEREELRGILNSGHTRRTAYVVRTGGQDHEPQTFSTWAPKVIALIGRLPATLDDRSIRIPMRRKAPGERVERLRLDRLEDVGAMGQQCLRWAADQREALRSADPEVPAELHDRAGDNWRPLLAIADIAGGKWPEAVRQAALVLSAGEAANETSLRVELLRDIREVFASVPKDRLATQNLLGGLCADEAKPWRECNGGKPLSAISLARRLRPFGVKPRKFRESGGKPLQGYLRADFTDAFSRYLPPEPEHPEQSKDDGGFRRSSTRNTGGSVPGRESAETPMETGVVPGVPAQGGEGESGKRQTLAEREVVEL